MSKKSSVEGIDGLIQMITDFGKLPVKTVKKAARSGIQIAYLSARHFAPVDTGQLRRGLKIVGERSKRMGKKTFQVTFDRAKNDIFAKYGSENPENGIRKRYYYPASQEYGFQTVNGRYIPGYNYLRKSIEVNDNRIEKTMIDVLIEEIEKLR